MRALLISPELPRTYWGQQYVFELIGMRGAAMPPLGLATVAALCPSDWELRLVDMNIEELRDEDLRWAELALIGGMAVQHDSMVEVLRRCGALGLRTVVGGPHATATPERLPDADHLVLDEAELTLRPFLEDLAAGRAERIYTAKGEKPDVTTSPVPRFDLLQLDRYAIMGVQYSRGCPFNCEFCDIITLYGRRPRTKSPLQLLRELQALYDLGYRNPVFLVDDNFIGNKPKVKVLLPELARWMEARRFPFSLLTEASMNLADDDQVLDLMARAGFTNVFIGIETPSLEGLKETNKLQNTRSDMIRGIHKIHTYGMEVMGGFIVGFDSDKEDIFDRQIRFITDAKIPMAMVGMLVALPLTQLWDRLEREGRLREAYSGDHFELSNFETVMPPEVLLRGYQRVLATLYEPDAYFERTYQLMAALDSNRKHPHAFRLSTKMLWQAVRSIVIQGGFSSYRRSYRRFLFRIWRDHRRVMSHAIRRAVTGHHFIEYTSRDVLPQLQRSLDRLSAGAPAWRAPERTASSPERLVQLGKARGSASTTT